MRLDLDAYRNVGDAFTERAAQCSERTAVTFFEGSAAQDHESLSFAELARRAGVRAAALEARLAPGDRVLIALPTCSGFVEVYLACLLAGLVAVPVPVPGGSATATARVAAIAEECAPRLAVTTGPDREALVAFLRERGLDDVVVEGVGEAGPGEPPALVRRSPDRDALAVLQYSSGSTGMPKGVMLTHGNVLANTAALGEGSGVGPGDSFGIWLPLHHDMGLFGQLTTALLFGAPIVLMPPTRFVRRPVEWLRMMDRFGTTVTAAPNFAYELCVRAVSDEALDELDLSRLRIAFNGSEPVHVPSMTAFSKRFARAGLKPEVVSPAYGLAEATVYTSTNRIGVPPTILVMDPRRLEAAERPELVVTSSGDGREITGVGTPARMEVRIVDPATCRTLPDGAVGEIWLHGANVGRGFWNRPDLSEKVFGVRLADGGDDPGDWLRTGDRGAVVAGELFITGRIKEMLIVNGRNLSPHDLEQEARATHPALTGFVGAVFGVAAPEERIVLAHEVDPRTRAEDLPGIAAAVTRRLTIEFGVPMRNVVLVRRGTVLRTTSGKIQRNAMRELFLAGGLAPLHAELEPGVRRILAAGAA